MSPSLLSRFRGALLGCAVGDALGAPYEGRSEAELASIPDLASDFRKVPGFPLGQYTDDTQLTLALAEAYAEAGYFAAGKFVDSLIHLWKSGETVGAGAACTAAVYNLMKGVAWEMAGAPPGQAGNGAAMRASPVGLFRWNEPDALVHDSIEHARITHQDPRAWAGAIAVSFAVAWNLAEKPPEPELFCRELSALITEVHAEFAGYIRQLPEWMAEGQKYATARIECAGWIEKPRILGAVTPFVIPSVLAALRAFLNHPDDFQGGVEEVIRLGGDVDTTAAMTAAIIGAKGGEECIPARLREGVLNAGKIRKTAERLFQKWREKNQRGKGGDEAGPCSPV